MPASAQHAAPAGCRRRTRALQDRTARPPAPPPRTVRLPSAAPNCMRAERCVEDSAVTPVCSSLICSDLGMRVVSSTTRLPAPACARRKSCGARQPGDPLGLAVRFRACDVQPQLAAPVIDAIPVQRAFAGPEAGRADAPSRRLDVEAARRCAYSAGMTLEPEVVVERQIEQRAVEIEQNGIYVVPRRRLFQRRAGIGPYHTRP